MIVQCTIVHTYINFAFFIIVIWRFLQKKIMAYWVWTPFSRSLQALSATYLYWHNNCLNINKDVCLDDVKYKVFKNIFFILGSRFESFYLLKTIICGLRSWQTKGTTLSLIFYLLSYDLMVMTTFCTLCTESMMQSDRYTFCCMSSWINWHFSRAYKSYTINVQRYAIIIE